MLLFQITLKNILRRKSRSLLTILGIAIGVTAVTALLAVSQGFVDTWTRTFAQRGTDLMVVKKAEAGTLAMATLDQKYVEKLEALEGIDKVNPVLGDSVTVDGKPMCVVSGLDPERYVIKEKLKVISGRLLTKDDKDVVMLNNNYAEVIKKKVGDKIDVEGKIFTIIGIIKASSIWEGGMIIFKLDELQELMERQNVLTGIGIRLKDVKQKEAMKLMIEEKFPELAAMNAEEASNKGLGTRMAQATALGISGIALAVGIIGTMNTMIMSIFERTKEIGVLRALGWKRRKVLRMILSESIMLSIVGGILGLICGVLICYILKSIPSIKGYIDPTISFGLFFKAIIISLLLGIIGGLYPAYRASQLSPMEALRHE